MLASNWQPTAHLCWIGGKLQQKWTRDCSDYRDVGGQRPLRHAWVEHEWREVPTEDLPPLRAEMETSADLCPTTGQPHRMPKGQVCLYCHIGNLPDARPACTCEIDRDMCFIHS